ncbi:MAG: hypothetical protein ABFS34_08095 [Gemmatimonadota bacterium]
MKRVALSVAALVAFGATGLNAQEAAESETLTVTVVDLSCKVVHNLSGDDHRMCAQVCADKGIPLALMTEDGTIMVPVSMGMPGVGDNERLKEHAENTVTVTGKVFDRGGLKTIAIEEIEA